MIIKKIVYILANILAFGAPVSLVLMYFNEGSNINRYLEFTISTILFGSVFFAAFCILNKYR